MYIYSKSFVTYVFLEDKILTIDFFLLPTIPKLLSFDS